jgi:hypothetical protein
MWWGSTSTAGKERGCMKSNTKPKIYPHPHKISMTQNFSCFRCSADLMQIGFVRIGYLNETAKLLSSWGKCSNLKGEGMLKAIFKRKGSSQASMLPLTVDVIHSLAKTLLWQLASYISWRKWYFLWQKGSTNSILCLIPFVLHLKCYLTLLSHFNNREAGLELKKCEDPINW